MPTRFWGIGMTEPAIELDWELEKDRRKLAVKRAKQFRKRLVMGHGNSRPAFLINSLKRFFGDGHAEALLEQFYGWFAWSAWLFVILATVASERSPDIRDYMFDNWFAGFAVIVVGLVLLLVIMLDVGTYEPRLFAICAVSPTMFFMKLSETSTTLRMQLRLIEREAPQTWRRTKQLEEGLLAESSEFLVYGGVRRRVFGRVLHRLGGIVASLALLGYGLSALSGGRLLAVCDGGAEHSRKACEATQSLPEHVYFALDSFFTGFSDLTLVHDALGYGYLFVLVLTFTLIVYFFLTEVVAGQSEFRANMRSAAESYVLQQSRL